MSKGRITERDVLRSLLPDMLAAYGDDVRCPGLTRKTVMFFLIHSVWFIVICLLTYQRYPGMLVLLMIPLCRSAYRRLQELNVVDYIINCAAREPDADLNDIIERELQRK